MRTGYDNPQGMTLAELRDWLEKCQLLQINDQAQPTVRISLTGKIKKIEVSDS